MGKIEKMPLTVFEYEGYKGERSVQPQLPDTIFSYYTTGKQYARPSLFIDYNNDGWDDIITSYQAFENDYNKKLFVNNKNGTWTLIEDPLEDNKVPYFFTERQRDSETNSFTFLDVNGDNQNDHHTSGLWDSNNQLWQTRDIDGDGVFESTILESTGCSVTSRGLEEVDIFSLPANMDSYKKMELGEHLIKGAGQFLDLNGDGLDDFVFSKNHHYYKQDAEDVVEKTEYILINEGDNNYVDYSDKFELPTYFRGVYERDRGDNKNRERDERLHIVKLLDENQDGLTDILVRSSAGDPCKYTVYPNLGEGTF